MLTICFLGTLRSAILSDGVYHEDDLTHYLFARWVGEDPRYLLDAWGRPGFTVVYALPAMIGGPQTGLLAGRIVSAVLSVATAWLAYRIASRLHIRHAWLAIPLLYCQPLFTRLSFTTLTEAPLAFYFALATWLLLKGRITASAIVMALAPVTRDEAVVVLPLWAFAMWRLGAPWWNYLLLGWAVAAQNLASAVFLTETPIQRWLHPGGGSLYGHGTPLTYIPHLITVAGIVVAALALMGSRRLVRHDGGRLIVLATSAYFVAETVIYWRGAFASGGYARFLVPVCPWLAILATAGVGPLLLRRRDDLRIRVLRSAAMIAVSLWGLCEFEWWMRGPIISPEKAHWVMVGRIAAAAVTALTLLAVACLMPSKAGRLAVAARGWLATAALLLLLGGPAIALIPMRIHPQQQILREAAGPLADPRWQDKPIISLNAWVYFWSDRWMPQSPRVWHELLDRAAPGTLFAWDARFCTEPYPNLVFEEMCLRPDWELVWAGSAEGLSRRPFVAFFERRLPVELAGPASQPSPTTTPALLR